MSLFRFARVRPTTTTTASIRRTSRHFSPGVSGLEGRQMLASNLSSSILGTVNLPTKEVAQPTKDANDYLDAIRAELKDSATPATWKSADALIAQIEADLASLKKSKAMGGIDGLKAQMEASKNLTKDLDTLDNSKLTGDSQRDQLIKDKTEAYVTDKSGIKGKKAPKDDSLTILEKEQMDVEKQIKSGQLTKTDAMKRLKTIADQEKALSGDDLITQDIAKTKQVKDLMGRLEQIKAKG